MIFREFDSAAFQFLYEKYGRELDYDIVSMAELNASDCLIRYTVEGKIHEMVGHLEYEMFRKKMRPRISFTERPVSKNKPLQIRTKLGVLSVEPDEDEEYPGFWIDFNPKAANSSPASVARVEVKQPEGDEPVLVLHSYIASTNRMRDVDGQLPGTAISFDGPFYTAELSEELISQAFDDTDQ